MLHVIIVIWLVTCSQNEPFQKQDQQKIYPILDIDVFIGTILLEIDHIGMFGFWTNIFDKLWDTFLDYNHNVSLSLTCSSPNASEMVTRPLFLVATLVFCPRMLARLIQENKSCTCIKNVSVRHFKHEKELLNYAPFHVVHTRWSSQDDKSTSNYLG